jgi:hypothetical protein
MMLYLMVPAAVTNDLDMTFVSWIRSIGYPIVSDWRPHDANCQVAGSVSLRSIYISVIQPTSFNLDRSLVPYQSICFFYL